MAIAKGTNSYATVEEAELYFADRLDVAAWTDADAAQKAQALVTATSILDEQRWVSCAISESQSLAFPREGTYYDERMGLDVELSPVPKRIVNATFELSYHLLNNDGILDDTGSVRSLNVSSINLSEIVRPNLIPGVVRRLIKPLLENSGSRGWWRAN
jgi:hypothetical protein